MSKAKFRTLQPPIQVYGLAGNYAAALYSAGKKAKELDRVTEDISQVGFLEIQSAHKFPGLLSLNWTSLHQL